MHEDAPKSFQNSCSKDWCYVITVGAMTVGTHE